MGLILAYRGGVDPGRVARHPAEEREYLAARQGLMSEGRPGGYRQVAASVGMNVGSARRLMEQIKAKAESEKKDENTA